MEITLLVTKSFGFLSIVFCKAIKRHSWFDLEPEYLGLTSKVLRSLGYLGHCWKVTWCRWREKQAAISFRQQWKALSRALWPPQTDSLHYKGKEHCFPSMPALPLFGFSCTLPCPPSLTSPLSYAETATSHLHIHRGPKAVSTRELYSFNPKSLRDVLASYFTDGGDEWPRGPEAL